MAIQPSSSMGPRKRVRMRDVANRCGVSLSTVSLVLSGDTRIPEDTSRLVLQAVKAMEYRPSVVARSLARRASRTIGVVLPEFAFSKNKAFYYQALEGIHSQTQSAGYKMVVEASNKVFLARRYYLRLLKEQSADGLIYLASSTGDNFLKEMEREPYPFVLVGAYADQVNLPCARCDDQKGAEMAVQHLISLGHKKIGHISGIREVSQGRDREKGYRQAMKGGGLSVENAWVVPGGFDPEESEKATLGLIKEKVTAIFAGNDVMAMGALRALKKAQVRVPEDVAVVGMDDLETSAWLNPSLTTIRTHIRTLAENAAKYIMQRVQNPSSNKIVLANSPSLELIVRSSCGSKK